MYAEVQVWRRGVDVAGKAENQIKVEVLSKEGGKADRWRSGWSREKQIKKWLISIKVEL
jgi:hypothetical protein